MKQEFMKKEKQREVLGIGSRLGKKELNGEIRFTNLTCV